MTLRAIGPAYPASVRPDAWAVLRRRLTGAASDCCGPRFIKPVRTPDDRRLRPPPETRTTQTNAVWAVVASFWGSWGEVVASEQLPDVADSP